MNISDHSRWEKIYQIKPNTALQQVTFKDITKLENMQKYKVNTKINTKIRENTKSIRYSRRSHYKATKETKYSIRYTPVEDSKKHLETLRR